MNPDATRAETSWGLPTWTRPLYGSSERALIALWKLCNKTQESCAFGDLQITQPFFRGGAIEAAAFEEQTAIDLASSSIPSRRAKRLNFARQQEEFESCVNDDETRSLGYLDYPTSPAGNGLYTRF